MSDKNSLEGSEVPLHLTMSYSLSTRIPFIIHDMTEETMAIISQTETDLKIGKMYMVK